MVVNPRRETGARGLFMYENQSRIGGEGRKGRVFFPFCRTHHATAMTHHRKSSSEKLMGGFAEQSQASTSEKDDFQAQSSK